MNQITCAANVVRQDMSGFSIEQIRASMAYVLNVPSGVEAYVRGRRIGHGYRLQPNDHLVFVRTCGSKGANEARNCFRGSDREATKRFYKQLEERGQLGRLAAHIFKAQKTSSRAGRYKGGIRCHDGKKRTFRKLAYARANNSVEVVCEMLSANSFGMKWGWKNDPSKYDQPNVLCIDLPVGQVNVYLNRRFKGPEYYGEVSSTKSSEVTTIKFCQDVFDGGQDGRNQKQ